MAFGADTPSPAPVHPGTAVHPEIIMVDSRTVACDGGDGAAGHPLVYLRIEKEQTFCPWCSRIFRLVPGAGHEGH